MSMEQKHGVNACQWKKPSLHHQTDMSSLMFTVYSKE